MRRASIVLVLGLAAGSALAQSKEPILLREMGSFHIGGRVIEITGQPIKEIVFTPGGVPAKMDPNGKAELAGCGYLVLNFSDPAPPSPRGVLANATPRRFPFRLITRNLSSGR